MSAKLTNEMRSEIAAGQGKPLRVVDEASNETFYLISEVELNRLQALADGEHASRLRRLIAEGDSSPDVPGDVARERILRMAKEADARHA